MKQNEWRANKGAALGLRFAIILGPLIAAWAAVSLLSAELIRPQGRLGLIVWAIQAFAIGFVVAHGVDRWTRKLVPLSSLFGMSLVFPDEAPSRFSKALRAGSAKRLQERIGNQNLKSRAAMTPQAAATEALGMVTLLGKHDRLTRGHSERVRAYADLIAEELNLSSRDRNLLTWSTLLHDIGKLAVPSEILSSPERPTADDWQTLKRHPEHSAELLVPLEGWLGEWIGAATEHHERFDGGGYPKGLTGTEISLAGRITAVADAFDTMTSVRSYKKAHSHKAAKQELVACSGTQFDPDIVRAFLNVSVGTRWSAGRFSWIAELPALVTTGLGTVPAATMSAAISTVAITGAAIAPNFGPVPAELASVSASSDQTTTITASTGAEDAPPAGGGGPSLPSTTDPTSGPGGPASSSTTSPGPGGTTPTTDPTNLTSTTSSTGIGSTPTTLPVITTTTSVGGTIDPTLPTIPTTIPTTPLLPTTTTTQPTTTAAPNPPVAIADVYVVNSGASKDMFVLNNDSPGGLPFDLSTLNVTSSPSNAQSLSVNRSSGTVRYRSNTGFVGVDQFRYRICNSAGQCSSAWVTITVLPAL